MDPRLETEVHFDSILTMFGTRKAPRGPLCLAIYSVWCQESASRSTLTYYSQCLGPGERPEVHFD
eukprot:3989143-Heterocapsa_arctica.AAC.1